MVTGYKNMGPDGQEQWHVCEYNLRTKGRVEWWTCVFASLFLPSLSLFYEVWVWPTPVLYTLPLEYLDTFNSCETVFLRDWGNIIQYLLFVNVYLFLRERERKHERARGRERGRQSIGSRLCADSREPNAGLEPMNCEITTWAEVGHLTDWATQASLDSIFF